MFDLTKICRLCMHGVQNAPKIYNCLTADIRDLIKRIHGFECSALDNLPKSLCSECYQKLQHFSTHLTLVERAQNEVKKLAALELETTEVKTEPQDEEPSKCQTDATDATEVKETLETHEDSDDSISTVSHISARSLEVLEESPSGSHLRKSLNSSKDENEPTSELPRRSRSKKRSLTKEKETPSKSELGKRKREQSKGEGTPSKSKKARPVTLKRVANSSPNRMEYEITNSPNNIERANKRKKASKEPIASTSTPSRAKHDQSSITQFFKKANTCESCGTFSKDSAYLKFHETFHSTRRCPGCFIKFAGDNFFDVTKHIACYMLKSKLSKAELVRMNGMQVTVSKLSHEQIRKVDPKCCTEKLPAKPKAKDRKRQASTQRVKPKEAKASRKDRGQTKKSSSNVDIDAPRDERKKSKSKSTTETKGNMDDSMEVEEIGNISVPLNWNPETAKDKVFWIRSFGSNDPIYIPIKRKTVQTNSKLVDAVNMIDSLAKKANETALNLSTPKTPQSKPGVNAQNQSSSRVVPRNRSASVFIQAPGALRQEVDQTNKLPAIRLSHGQGEPRSVPASSVAQIPTNNGIITCIRKSVLLNTSNSSNMAQNMIVPKQAGLINARRKSVATEMTRIAMNKSFHQAHLAPARRSSISLEQRPNALNNSSQMGSHYQQNTPIVAPNTGAISLRSINADHSYIVQNQPDRGAANQLQTIKTQYNCQIRPAVTFSLQNITPSQSPLSQPQFMTSIARDAFLPSPFPVNTSTLVAPAIDNPVSTVTQSAQPKRTQLKILTVADLNAKVPTGNLSPLPQPIPQLDQSNPSDVQVIQSSGFQVSKPRVKLTPVRQQPTEPSNVIPDTEAISVSLSKIHDDHIELTLNIRGQRIDYESLNDQQKTDVKQCLLKNDIWKEMLGHIKQGLPTKETLNLFRKLLPPKERQEFFETYYKR